MELFINISNHPSTKWSEEQKAAAKAISGAKEIIDLQFPNVDPHSCSRDIREQAIKIVNALPEDPYGLNTYHVMGEMTLTYAIISYLRQRKGECVPIVASTTERVVTENPDGTKTSIFKFVQFRRYPAF